MDYSDFTVEDLASDERFINWVKGGCSQEEKDFWRLLVLSHPGLEEKVDRARILVINVDRAEEGIDLVDPEKVREIWQNVLMAIDQTESATDTTTQLSHRSRPVSMPQRRRWVLALAASIVFPILFASTFLLLRKDTAQPSEWYSYSQQNPGFIEVANTTQNPMHLVMTDSSVILLGANSRIKYKNDFTADTIRRVYLQGEAFFDVSRDPQKPFVVLANHVATEVLGTSFRIKVDSLTSNVAVKVKTGKVSVYSVKKHSPKMGGPKAGVILLPNQEVVYVNAEGQFEKKIVDTPELLKSRFDHDFVFDNTPIAEVFERLEDAYGVEILFDQETMKSCFLTVPLGSEPLFDKLKVICRTIGAHYEVIDAKVVITSAGCKTIDSKNLNE